MPIILQTKALSKSFDGLQAVSNTHIQVEENSITGLIGPNGAGKTTFFDLLTGFMKQDSGEIFFQHQDISRMSAWQRARMGIARTFQAIRLFPELTVIDNILAALPGSPDSFFDIFQPLSKKKRELHKRALELLKLVNLENHAQTRANSLSYGQQKLLEIIRAYAGNASLFLLDEPAAGVNRTMLIHIVDLIKQLKSWGKTILLVEHDMHFVMSLCEKVIVMDRGKEIAEGKPEAIQKNPLVLEAYLGKSHTHHAQT